MVVFALLHFVAGGALPQGVLIQKAEAQEVRNGEVLQLKGTVEAGRIQHVWGLTSSGMSGFIKKKPKAGDTLKKGVKVVELDYVPDYLAALNAALDQTKATHRYKKEVLGRAEYLLQQEKRLAVQRGATSNDETDKKVRAVLVASADVAAAAATIKVAEGNSTPYEPVVPWDATVLEVNCELGDTVQPQLYNKAKPWVILGDLSTLKIEVLVPRKALTRIVAEESAVTANGGKPLPIMSIDADLTVNDRGEVWMTVTFVDPERKDRLKRIMRGDNVTVSLKLK